MDLTARVEALEEEVSVLKNEIKAILQEVRVAVLARENPFVSAAVEAPVSASFSAVAAPIEEQPSVIPFRPMPQHEEEIVEAAPRVMREVAMDMRPAEAPEEWAPNQPRHWSRHELATFMQWTQDVTERFGRRELTVMLGIARHGGLITQDLEETLLLLGDNLRIEESRPAGFSDYLLALRELDALENPEAIKSNTQRRAA
jgi:hypothetical protein